MTLKILYVGHRNSIQDVNPNSITSILGGTVLAVNGSGLLVPCDGNTQMPVGLAINPATGNPFESSSAIGSGKAPYVMGMGVVEIDADGYVASEVGSLTWGDKLYAGTSGNVGKLTRSTPGGVAQVVGVVTRPPTTTEPFMQVALRI